MKLGLLGYPLSHSFSSFIHNYLIGVDYELFEVPSEEFERFMEDKNFDGINVTIPYKEKVISYLDEVSPIAKEAGAVNCIINKDGKLKGYNTDALGFGLMIDKNCVEVKDKKVAVLGSGGAAKGCRYALKERGALVDIISRNAKEGCITYEDMNKKASEYEVIVNTTPLGLYPNIDDMPNIDFNLFSNLKTVIDILANPLKTKLMFEAKCRGLEAYGGLEMLVYQAYYADELFLNKEVDINKTEACLKELIKEKSNITLIGMPTSGKTTVAKELGYALNREVLDMDKEIVKRMGMSISECFETKGEDYFRKEEKVLAKELAKQQNLVIACGGGVIKDKETMRYLSHNSIVIWLDRDKEMLMAKKDRPLSMTKENLYKLYDERYPLYEMYSDYRIENNEDVKSAVKKILEKVGN